MNRLMKKADVTRAMAAARGLARPPGTPSLPPDDAITELSRVAGLGPVRARVIYEALGVSTLVELRSAIEDGRVSGLRGFSAGAVDRLREGVAALLDPRASLPLADAELHVERLLAYMRQAPAAQSVEAAGAYRRRCDVVDSIVLLVVSSRPALAMRYFRAYADAVTTSSADPSRGSLTLHCGLRVELRIVPARCHGATLHHVTGAAAYEAAMRALGLEHGVRISDYGVFRIDPGRAGARRVGGQKEEDVFDALGMQWVPPELRENDGEIEAALRHALPSLVTLQDIRGDLRLRTRRSDGEAGLEEMLRACRSARYAYCAIAEPFASASPRGLDAAGLREQAEEIAALRPKFPSLHVLHAAEVSILPDGELDIDDDASRTLDIIIGAAHTRPRLSRAKATERLLRALEDPRLDVLAYVTGRRMGERVPLDADYDEVFRAAAVRGVALELSAQPRRLDPPHQLLRAAAGAGVRVIVSTAAGSPAALATMRFGVDQARRAWLPVEAIVNTRPWPELGPLRRRAT